MIRFIIGALLMAAALVIFIAPFASQSPDGLERIAMDKGFEHHAEGQEVIKKTVLPDYSIPGVQSEYFSTVLAGLAGVLFITGLGMIIGRLLYNKRKQS